MGKISSGRAESVVKAGVHGDYLIRESESKKGSFTVVINLRGKAVNSPVRYEGSLYHLGVCNNVSIVDGVVLSGWFLHC